MQLLPRRIRPEHIILLVTAAGRRLFWFKTKTKRLLPKKEFIRQRGRAYDLVLEKLKNFNEIYKFKYRKISIRNQKTRWGSCSKKGNLNFNYKVVYLPNHLADYLVVHELCHLGEMNHSKRFWALVAKTFPDYRTMRRELKNIKV